jgi:flagellar motor switch protein FliN/FliY
MATDTDLPLPQLDTDDVSFAGGGAPPPEPPSPRTPSDLHQILDVPVTVSAVLGHSRMPVGDLLKIGPGSLLELDRKVGQPIDILVNNRLVARGEVVLVDDRLGVTMTEIVKSAA